MPGAITVTSFFATIWSSESACAKRAQSTRLSKVTIASAQSWRGAVGIVTSSTTPFTP